MRDLNLVGLAQAITNRVITFCNLITGASANSNFFNVTGTLPSTLTAEARGVQILITTGGSSAQFIKGFHAELIAGYTGANATFSLEGWNLVSGTSVNWAGTAGNVAVIGITNQNGTGTSVGVMGKGQNTTGDNIGVVGLAATGGTGHKTGVAGAAIATHPTGGYFCIGLAGNPAIPDGALVGDNGPTGLPILLCVDNTTTVFTVDTLGNIRIFRTVTAAGTTGAQTINKPAGTIRIAAAGTNVVLTNSLITATSIIMATLQTNDGTAKSVNVVPAAGSCTFTLNAACTGEVAIGFLVTN